MTESQVSFENRTMKKVMRRIIPFVFILYVIAFLDRVNLGYAALEMNKDLALAAEVFGLVSGIFFIGYFLFEVPSNILMDRIGARIWLARILITWGLIVVLTGWVQSAAHLYILRFLLGAAEAGAFPGIPLYLTYWFRSKERARAVALFTMSVPVAGIISAPVSTWILDNITWFGMTGWRWIFIVEGIPAVILGIVTLFYLTDRPKDAKWLTEEEKTWLEGELKAEHEAKVKVNNYSKKEVFKNADVWMLGFAYFTSLVGMYALSFWMPSIIDSLSGTLSNTLIGLLAMIPFIAGVIAMVLWARHSDKKGERWIHTIAGSIFAAAGFIGCALTDNPYIAVAMFTIASMGIFAGAGPFWSLPSLFLTETSAAVGIAIINSVGNLGGLVGAALLGFFGFSTGLLLTSTLFVVGVTLILIVKKRQSQFQPSLDAKGESV